MTESGRWSYDYNADAQGEPGEDTHMSYNIARAITKSDSINFDSSTYVAGEQPVLFDAIYVGGAGVVAVVLQDGSVLNVTAVAGGTLPIQAIRVNSTNTTATVMTALRSV